MKMNDFLLEYYKRYIFRAIPPEQFAQFGDYLDKGDLRGNMKYWAKELLQPDPTDPNKYYKIAGVYQPKSLLEASDLDNADWEKLYKAFQDAFVNMNADRKSFKYDEKATKFLDKHFGPEPGKLFNHSEANTETENALGRLKKLLTDNPRAMEMQLKTWGIVNDDLSFKDIIDGIGDIPTPIDPATGRPKLKKYNTNLNFRKALIKAAQYIDYYKNDTDFRDHLTNPGPGMPFPDLTPIETGFSNIKPSARQIDVFKLEFHRLLQELQTNSAGYKVFKQYDNGKISKHLDAARNFLDYDSPDKDEYLRPKREDELTIPQQISKWVSDQYDDYLSKYVKFSGDRLFLSPQAMDIVAALTKQKVKPTDGLDGIAKKSGDITKALKAADKQKSAKHMDWLAKQLNDFANDKNMAHVYKGALKNGWQMRHLIQELIFKAIKEGKIDEAKTAMEVLSVAKFGYTTSATMDALNKMDVTIFSDKGLSWNKNEAVKVVTTAIDKSIKFAIRGIGYAATIGINSIRLAGSKIHKTNKTLSALRTQKQAENDAAKAQLQSDLDNERINRDSHQEHIDRLAGYGVTDASLQTKVSNLETEIHHIHTTILEPKIRHLNSILTTAAATGTPHPHHADIMAFLSQLNTDVLPSPLTTGDPAIDTASTDIIQGMRDIARKSARMESAQNRINDLSNANSMVAALTQRIHDNEAEILNWDSKHTDQAEELVNYWNKLEAGRGTHTGLLYNWFGSKKAAQKALTKDSKNIINQIYQQGRGKIAYS